VNDYLHSWKVPDNRFTANEKVTLRRIVSHSAGLTVGGFPGYTLGDSIPSLLQILDGSKPANTPPIRVDTFPGAIWRYSGGGMMVMQQLLMDETGESFPALMHRLVLEPLGLTRSTFEQPLPAAQRSQAASGHDGQGAYRREMAGASEQAAAGFWTTPAILLVGDCNRRCLDWSLSADHVANNGDRHAHTAKGSVGPWCGS
jgi:CubicO group peptidase (beta-lactamase class C family)